MTTPNVYLVIGVISGDASGFPLMRVVETSEPLLLGSRWKVVHCDDELIELNPARPLVFELDVGRRRANHVSTDRLRVVPASD